MARTLPIASSLAARMPASAASVVSASLASSAARLAEMSALAWARASVASF